MRSCLAFFIAILSLSPLGARTWTSADGEKTIEGEYVSHTDEHVVIKHGTKEIIVKYEFLSGADREWVENLDKKTEPVQTESVEIKTLLALVHHGDNESAVVRKLENDPHIEAGLSKAFLARVGLNGFFKTRNKLNGQQYTYHFDWDDNDRLSCITLRSGEFPKAEFEQRVKNAWLAGSELICKSYGEAKQASEYPPVSVLSPEANLMITHVWHPKGTEKTVALCVGIDEDKAFIAMNYYDRVIELQEL